jgi:hypothetical protein
MVMLSIGLIKTRLVSASLPCPGNIIYRLIRGE